MANYYHYNGKRYRLIDANNMLVTRTHSATGTLVGNTQRRGARVSGATRQMLEHFEVVMEHPDSCVQVLRIHEGYARPKRLRDKVIKQLGSEPHIRFAGRVLCEPNCKSPVLYTENVFVKFQDRMSPTACRRAIKQAGLRVKRSLGYAKNAYFCCLPEGAGRAVFDVANQLLAEDKVQYAHPELVRELGRNAAAPQQWHLQPTRVNNVPVDADANIVPAWNTSRGASVTIAVIDDGVDIDHDEFRGAGKILAPLNTTVSTNSTLRDNPRPGGNDSHGTACAGVACANGNVGASGVAPDASLMPIRLRAQLGSQSEADSFFHAARQGADVISCSWGPVDGIWFDPNDPRHNTFVPLPDSTRLAIDFAVNNGRNGRGCVICWAAGNGNEPVGNDGYASYPNVLAIAACNDLNTRAAYSDVGAALWCAFPSSNGNPSSTPGIWTTDRRGGAGYNPGNPGNGDSAGDYTNDFGGTSSACPGAAGVAALVLARNPQLQWQEVRDILRDSADKIDPQGGAYDAAGHSEQYGFGRLNGERAVALAAPDAPLAPNYTAIHTAASLVEIRDEETSSLAVEVGDRQAIASIAIAVEIEHTWSGDLTLTLVPPGATGVGAIVLRERSGESQDNVIERYTPATVAALNDLLGTMPTGTWELLVKDNAQQDQGAIRRFTVEVGL